MKSSEKRNKTVPGSRFGMLTVEGDTGLRKNGYIVWRCRCDCGGIINVDVRTLRRGTVQDCGCVSKTKPGQRDITNLRFGLLTARYCTEKRDAQGSYYWHCTCDCGGEIDVSIHRLQAGYRKSCGCLSRPPLKDMVGKHFGRLTVTSYAGKRNGMHRWKCICSCGNETVGGQTLLLSGKTKSCGCIKANIYKDNLKLIAGTSVTLLERVRREQNHANVSGHVGVYQNKRNCGKWCAQIGFRGKNYYLGSYDKIEEAIEARKRAEVMHDEFIDWYYNVYLPSKNRNDFTEAAAETVYS